MKWFHVIGVGRVYCTAAQLRSALGHGWTVAETAHAGIAYR